MNNLVKNSYGLTAVTLALLFSAGCSPKRAVINRPNLVSAVAVEALGPAPAGAVALANRKAEAVLATDVGPVSPTTTTSSASPMLTAHVTLSKAALFDRTFLYGSDLQYSSIGDPKLSLTVQSSATTHTPVSFRKIDNTLEMVADQHDQFESDNNHPERLIATFPVISEDATNITIDINAASPVLNTVVTDIKAAPARQSWVRSVKYVPEGQYVMYETSIEMADGTIAEFMETFFPRDTVIPADAKPMFADAALEPLAGRYRFLDTGVDIFVAQGDKRVKTKIATRFQSTPGKTIDWYITPNVPAEYLSVVKDGVEGWNRYSQKMWGKDIIAFKGILPADVKLGDPRYNVINWDSVADAGAAYETQASDPYTGIQTHSMVYLPKAWVNIGKEYWAMAGDTETITAKSQAIKAVLDRGTFLGRKLPVNCFRDAAMEISADSRLNGDQFSRELLRGVLFHEIGHSFGLAHNFKASTSFDPSDDKSPFSNSIMDYNQYQLQLAAFDGITGPNGPLLEYDRQVLSVLYNGGKDVASSDATLPACADSEADSFDGGVDPLCIRYDAGHDPTAYLQTTLALLKDDNAAIRSEQSLPKSIKALTAELASSADLKTADQVAADMKAKQTELLGTIAIYYAAGGESLASAVEADVHFLRQFKDGILSSGYVEADLRGRAIEGVRMVANLESFEPATVAAIVAYQKAMTDYLSSSPYVTGLSTDQQATTLKQQLAIVNATPNAIALRVFTKLRASLYKDLQASAPSPFALYTDAKTGATVDFEEEIATLLSHAATATLTNGSPRPAAERLAAATALQSFKATVDGADIVTATAATLMNQARSARDMATRNDAMATYKALTSTADPAAPATN